MSGSLTVFCGPMFSGKTEGLIRALTILRSNGLQVVALKPKIDNRYSDADILSHSKKAFPAEAIPTEERVDLSYLQECNAVGIDEVQFFGPWLIDEIKNLLAQGVDVSVSGLDLTFKGEPFGIMPHLLCLADDVFKLMSTCSKCSGMANRSHRKGSSGDAILVGGAESYEPRCLDCFENA